MKKLSVLIIFIFIFGCKSNSISTNSGNTSIDEIVDGKKPIEKFLEIKVPSSLSQIGDEDVRELLGVIAACSLIKTYFLVSAGERYESEELSIDKYNQIKYNTKNYLEEYASLKRLVESKYNIEEHESKALFETTNGKMLALLTENGEKKQFKEKNEYLKSLHSSHYNIIYSSECNNKLSPLVSSMKFNNEHSG